MKSYTQYQPKARFLCLTHLKDYKEADNIKWLIQMDYQLFMLADRANGEILIALEQMAIAIKC